MKYNRILLKLSGEILGGVKGHGIDPDAALFFAREIKPLADSGVQIGIVIGGGNLFRGAQQTHVDRVTGDYMGMMATIMNALALRDTFIQNDLAAVVMTPFVLPAVAETFQKQAALEHLNSGKITIFAGGTGNPYFTTDSAAALRAAEIEADVLIKGTKVDGVYTADPMKDETAVKYESLTFSRAISEELKVMDISAMTLCKENHIPLMVFKFNKDGELMRLIQDEKVGTLVSEA